jgi:hypothetical protein
VVNDAPGTPGRRTLVYGMQSSGASLVALLLAQRPDAVGLLDVYCGEWVPCASVCPPQPVVAKATVSTAVGFAEQRARLAPDATLLVLRHPVHTYVSLLRKEYAGMGGDPDDKLRILEREFANRDDFDIVVRYEDVVLRPEIALADLQHVDATMTMAAFGLPRSASDVVSATRAVPAFGETFAKTWDRGNVDARAIDRGRVFKHVTGEIRRHVENLCPSVSAACDRYYADAFPAWRVSVAAWWADIVYPRARAAALEARRAVSRVGREGGQ